MGLRFVSYCAVCIVLFLLSFDHAVIAKKVDYHHLLNAKQNKPLYDNNATNPEKVLDHHHGRRNQNQRKNCNIFHGSWVWDNSSSTIPYDPMTCPFIRKEFACKKYGRVDDLYLKYRWQPMSCNIPRFYGQDFLRRFKGKKIMFIGDSLSRNAWVSLSCLLYAAVPTAKFTIETKGAMTTVTFQDYGVSVIYFLSLHLVDIEKERTSRIMKIDSIKDGDIWKNMDVLIFNTFQWWGRRGPKQQWDYIQEGGKIYSDMDRMVAFRKGLTTWANWVNTAVDTRKTRVFYQGISPSHYNGIDWNRPGEKNCGKETQPLKGSIYPGGVHPATIIVNEVLSTTRKLVHLLDLTTLSQLRPDAHPSSYNGFRGMDCTHWCVPGLPDTWNQLLYTSLISL